ncbi:MAG: hypothetical protein H6R05_963 [Burkholderiaceae bacterium]|nr:hypothetical protein [Burkholderiaceae bacterium]
MSTTLIFKTVSSLHFEIVLKIRHVNVSWCDMIDAGAIAPACVVCVQ